MSIGIYDSNGVGRRIQQLRKMHGYTREQFSEKIDISPKFLYEVERGLKGFSVQILFRMTQELSVSCDYIISGNDWIGYGEELQEALALIPDSKRKDLADLIVSASKLSTTDCKSNLISQNKLMNGLFDEV